MTLGEEQSHRRAKGKIMKQGRTLGAIAVFVGGLLLNLTAVYAFHFIAGGGIYSLTSNGSETSVQFQFLGVKYHPVYSRAQRRVHVVPAVHVRYGARSLHSYGARSQFPETEKSHAHRGDAL